jgi:hypothetical protein
VHGLSGGNQGFSGHRFLGIRTTVKIWGDTKKIETKILAEMPYGPEKLAEKI